MIKSITKLFLIVLTICLACKVIAQNGNDTGHADALAQFDQILTQAETIAFNKFKRDTDATPQDPPTGGGAAGAAGTPGAFSTMNSPTLSPINTPITPIPPPPRANSANPWEQHSQENPWATQSQSNPWARPTAPPIGSPLQAPAFTAPPPSNIYLPPSTPNR